MWPSGKSYASGVRDRRHVPHFLCFGDWRSGSAPRSGRGGRQFKSGIPDREKVRDENPAIPTTSD